jgi:hypothetical protein
MQLIVSGSTKEYIPGSNTPLEEIRLLITKKYLTLLTGNFNLDFPNREIISSFASRIAVNDHAGMLDTIHEYGFFDLEQAFSAYTPDQVNLFKSVFLIYGTVEEQLTKKTDQKNGRRLYDKLILEKRLPPAESGVLYFIRESYLDESYDPLLNKLVALQLLCKARLVALPTTYTTYFTTLNHHSASRKLLNGDPDDHLLISVWQMIQEDKRKKMYNSFNMSS